MYSILLSLHSHTRWLVLVAALAAIIIPILNAKSGKIQKLPALLFLIFCDIQLLAGLMLYFGESPFGIAAFENGMGHVMKTGQLRKIAVEHFTLMLIALTLVHIGYSKFKKAENSEKAKKVSLVFFGIALILILAGIPWVR
jgi:heme A synthase